MLHARCNLPTDEAQGVHAEVLVALHLVVEGVWAPALCEKDNADLEQRKIEEKGALDDGTTESHAGVCRRNEGARRTVRPKL